jgi:dTDP-4-amino-4,6-dideoxygalactose transaminase
MTLAILGGRPVRTTRLPYGRQSINDEDVRTAVEVLRSDWITTGPKVGEFEESFAACVGSRYAVSFSSGTAAMLFECGFNAISSYAGGSRVD